MLRGCSDGRYERPCELRMNPSRWRCMRPVMSVPSLLFLMRRVREWPSWRGVRMQPPSAVTSKPQVQFPWRPSSLRVLTSARVEFVASAEIIWWVYWYSDGVSERWMRWGAGCGYVDGLVVPREKWCRQLTSFVLHVINCPWYPPLFCELSGLAHPAHHNCLLPSHLLPLSSTN